MLRKLIVIALALVLLACSDNSEKEPQANAGADQLVPLGGVSLHLDGSQSLNINGADFLWQQISGSPVTIESPKSISTSITIPYSGWSESYTFKLTVSTRDGVSTDEVSVKLDAPDFSDIAVGIDSACVVDDGEVKCWGSTVVANVPALNGVPSELQMGYFHACVLVAGEVSCWGANNSGQTDVPVSLGVVQEIELTANVSCARDENGKQCWGDTSALQGLDVSQAGQVEVSTHNEFELLFGSQVGNLEQSSGSWGSSGAIIADISFCQNFPDPLVESLASCVVVNDQLQCAGNSLYSSFRVNLFFRRCEINNGSSIDWALEQLSVPVQGVSEMVMGGAHACLLHNNGVSCVGDNSRGQLDVPWQLGQPDSVAAGFFHTCASGVAGISCWGDFPVLPATAANAADFDSQGEHVCYIEKNNGVVCVSAERHMLAIPQAPFDISHLAWIKGLPEQPTRLLSNESAVFDLDVQGMGDDFEFTVENSSPAIATASLDAVTNKLDIQVSEFGYGDAVITVTVDNGEYQLSRELSIHVPRPLYLGVDQLDNSDTFACAVHGEDVSCWGSGERVATTIPYDYLKSALVIQTGDTHACAIDGDNGLICWGDMGYASQELLDAAPDVFDTPNRIQFDQPLDNPVLLSVQSDMTCVVDNNGLHCLEEGRQPWFKPLTQISTIKVNGNRVCTIQPNGLACYGRDGDPYIDAGMPAAAAQAVDISMGRDNWCALLEGAEPGWLCWKDYSNGVTNIPQTMINASDIVIPVDSACALEAGELECWGKKANILGLPEVEAASHLSASDNILCAANATGVMCWGEEFLADELPQGVSHVVVKNWLEKDGLRLNEAETSGVKIFDVKGETQSLLIENEFPGLVTASLNDDGELSYQAVSDAFGVGEFYVRAGDAQRSVARKIIIDVMPPLGQQLNSLHTSRNGACAISENGITCWGPGSGDNLHSFKPLSSPQYVDLSYGYCVIDDNGLSCSRGESLEVSGEIKSISQDFTFICLIDDDGLKCRDKAPPEDLIALPSDLIAPSEVSISTQSICVIDQGIIKCEGELATGIPVVQNPSMLSVNRDFACVVDDSNQVHCWGSDKNAPGILSPPSTSNVSQLEVGGVHACLLDNDTVKCWGDNHYGQTTPPSGLSNISQLSLAENYSCIISDGSDVVCWGDVPFDKNYDVMDGVFLFGAQRAQPFTHAVIAEDEASHDMDFHFGAWSNGFTQTINVSPQSLVSVSLLDGTLTISPQAGQTGIGQVTVNYSDGKYSIDYPIHVQVLPVISNVLDIAVTNNGPYAIGGGDSACALDVAGVHCWGGLSDYQPILSSPIELEGDSGQFCVIDGQDVVCWGPSESIALAAPKNLSNPYSISVAKSHACVLDDNGVHCWGDNRYGQLDSLDLSNPVFVETGETYSCVLDDSGMQCWGYLSSNSYLSLSNPVMLSPAATENGASNNYSFNGFCAIDDAGLNCYDTNMSIPGTLVAPNTVGLAPWHACALDGGQVICWSDGTSSGNSRAAAPVGISNASALSVSLNTSCVAMNNPGDVEIVCWGPYSMSAPPSGAFIRTP